jgi:hypothetical protein
MTVKNHKLKNVTKGHTWTAEQWLNLLTPSHGISWEDHAKSLATHLARNAVTIRQGSQEQRQTT